MLLADVGASKTKRQCREKSHHEFNVFVRQNIRFAGNFSIGLRYQANRGNLATITLVRYNGPHGETSRSPDGHYALPHIHYITEEEIARGHMQPQENHRELTYRYSSFTEALRSHHAHSAQPHQIGSAVA